ncbi:MAG: dimethylsulfonioproprionate lyase family protein [Pseudomonadota bacterium]
MLDAQGREAMPTKAQLGQSARAYVQALTAHLTARADADPALRPFVEALALCPLQVCRTEPRPRLDHPLIAPLDRVSSEIVGAQAFAGPVRQAADTMDWFPVFAGGGIDPRLADGMLAAQAVGTYGCFAHETLAVGIFIMAPGVAYPLHTHEATEIYLAVAGSISIQHGIDGTPFTLHPGDYSITPPHRVHALQTGEEPALVCYVWKGDLWCRNWWWAQDSRGAWTRTAWERPEAGPWRPLESEPVDPAIMAEAHAS